MVVLTENTKFRVGLGVAGTALILAAGFGFKAQAQLSTIAQAAQDANAKISDMNAKISAVETSLTSRLTSFEATMSDRFTKTAAAEWALRMLNANPTFIVPDPRDPSRFLNYGSK